MSSLTPADVFHSITPEDMQTQLALEAEGLDMGIQRYKERLEKMGQKKALGDHHSSRSLISHALHDMVPAFKEWLEEPSRGRLAGTKNFFKGCGLSPEEISFSALHSVLNRRDGTTIQTVAIAICKSLLDTIEYRKFKDQAGGLLHVIEERTKTHHLGHRKRVIMGAKKKIAEIPDDEYTTTQMFSIGCRLLDLIIENTGLVGTLRTRLKGRDTVSVVQSEDTQDWLAAYHEKSCLLSPTLLPMMVPPRPWSSLCEGGYWSRSLGNRPLPGIKAHSRQTASTLAEADLTAVYDTMSRIQATKWRVNPTVHRMMTLCGQLKYIFAGIPSSEPVLTPAPWGEMSEDSAKAKATDPEAWKEWKDMRTKEWDSWHASRCRRLAFVETLKLADRFLGRDGIYFPHTLDWRGRIYPMANYLHPQGDDVSRGLLEFGEGKKLTERGVYWVRIQLANTWGEDKVPLADRVQWALDNEEDILAYGNDPDANRGWAEADKPWQFLQACCDYAGWHADPLDHLSRLPVQQDGSNNGCQHFAAMLRDPSSGKSVNLVPSDSPSDVYQEVADKVALMVARDLHSTEEDVASMAAVWHGHISRDVVKRNTMTVPYGVTHIGMAKQLDGWLAQYEQKHGKPYVSMPSGMRQWTACNYLAKLNNEAVSEVLTSAYTAMQYLRTCAGQFAKITEVPVSWVTPAKHLVVQDYRREKTTRIQVYARGMRWRHVFCERGPQIDARKQGAAVAPNFVHSLDAAHMMRTVDTAFAQGITSFSLIHDSYGTHASDIDQLNAILRDEFVRMYEGSNMLAEFREGLIKQAPFDKQEELREALAPAPELGTLCLDSVRDSLYFFA
jgi:DNA-directed RNA polymerase, mitochondrial